MSILLEALKKAANNNDDLKKEGGEQGSPASEHHQDSEQSGKHKLSLAVDEVRLDHDSGVSHLEEDADIENSLASVDVSHSEQDHKSEVFSEKEENDPFELISVDGQGNLPSLSHEGNATKGEEGAEDSYFEHSDQGVSSLNHSQVLSEDATGVRVSPYFSENHDHDNEGSGNAYPIENSENSRQISRYVSQSSFRNISGEGALYYLRRTIFLLLVPVSFVLVVFYSAVEWYSQLNEEFQRSYRTSSIAEISREYQRIAQETNRAQKPVLLPGDEQGVQNNHNFSAPDSRNMGEKRERSEERALTKAAGSKFSSTGSVSRQSISKTRKKSSDSRVLGRREQNLRGVREDDSVHNAVLVLSETSLSKARSLLSEGKLKTAEKILQRELTSGEGSKELFFLLSYLYSKKEDYKRSILFVKKALAVDPYYRPAAELLAQILLKKEINGALDELKQLHDQVPDSDFISIGLAGLLVKNNRLDSALSVMMETYRIQPSADLAYNIASLFVAKGDVEKSTYFVHEAIRLSATMPASFDDRDIANLINEIKNISS